MADDPKNHGVAAKGATEAQPIPLWTRLRALAQYVAADWAVMLTEAAKELENLSATRYAVAVYAANEDKRVRIAALEERLGFAEKLAQERGDEMERRRQRIEALTFEVNYATDRNLKHIDRVVAAEKIAQDRLDLINHMAIKHAETLERYKANEAYWSQWMQEKGTLVRDRDDLRRVLADVRSQYGKLQVEMEDIARIGAYVFHPTADTIRDQAGNIWTRSK